MVSWKTKDIINEVKYQETDRFDFKTLDKLQNDLSKVKTESDALKYIKKYKFKGDGYYNGNFNNSTDSITHLKFGYVTGNFFIIIENTNSSNGIQILLNNKGKEI